jgi:hypothetical protein
MTTSVRVKHDGPGHHDVQVAITNGGVVVSTERLAEGDVKDFYVYDTQGLTVSEIPKRERQELAPSDVGDLDSVLGKSTGES